MRFTRRDFMVGAATAIAVTSIAWQASAAGVTLDLSEVLPESNYQTQNAKRFADEVAKVTKGDVKINVHAGGALGFKGPEQLRAVRDGLVPMADVLTSQQIGDEPLLGIETSPFLVTSYSDLRKLHDVMRPEWDKVAAKYNQKFLYAVPSPLQYMFLKVKTDTVEGLKGIKIRGADKTTVDICSSIGMAGIVIPWGELIPALASGRVEGVATSATSGVDGKFWEFLKYVYPTNHTWSSNVLSINLDAWKKIPANHQKAIEDLAKRMEPEFWGVADKMDKESIAKLTAQGMELVAIPPAMIASIQKMASPMLDAYVQKTPAAEPIIKRYLASVGRK
jgi:TRAP-type C4-dicarboxylate transport system substrate-binding protein